ncbi:hypothetical protein [Halorubrum coriense]|uniref:hypothetical protein n=1 Tax=Halorubrum coriense TaxID=64713 RepID=UPI0012682FC4|nr:hypothetical protein [Halorubrum coriense]
MPPEISSITEEAANDPPSIKDLLPETDELPNGWVLGTPNSTVGRRTEDPPSTAQGVRSRRHPQTDELLSSQYAEQRYVTSSDLPPEFGHFDITVEMARTDERSPYSTRSEAVRALHKITFGEERENWELLSTGWTEVDIEPADNWLQDRSVASIRKPQCAVPYDLNLSTNKPLIEMAVIIEPLSWGTVMVTATLLDADDDNRPSYLGSQIASQIAKTIREQPVPEEARQ